MDFRFGAECNTFFTSPRNIFSRSTNNDDVSVAWEKKNFPGKICGNFHSEVFNCGHRLFYYQLLRIVRRGCCCLDLE